MRVVECLHLSFPLGEHPHTHGESGEEENAPSMSQDVFLFGWHTTTAMMSAPLPVSSQPQWKATFIVAQMQCYLHYKGVDRETSLWDAVAWHFQHYSTLKVYPAFKYICETFNFFLYDIFIPILLLLLSSL